MNLPFNITLKEKQMEIADHPRYVQMRVNRNYLLLLLLASSTVAGCITFKSLRLLLFGILATLVLSAVTLHINYILTRDEALVLEGTCIDITESPILFSKRLHTKGHIVIKSNDPENKNVYMVPYQKRYHCNIGDSVSLYVMPNTLYMDMNDNVMINTPLFIKISKG